ncbi:hypothetical protein M5K25_021691 [Dendrobium thyrsiflorum]|uniref:Uncharacterized protein n=1 Tax=Dendrobium thyrsiflorum TaxID=117978 RepID=A0ABD0U4Y7_DENTH
MQNSPRSKNRLSMRKNLPLTRSALAAEDSPCSGERLSMLKKVHGTCSSSRSLQIVIGATVEC